MEESHRVDGSSTTPAPAREAIGLDTTWCPACGAPAEVQWRDVLESTDGPVEHAKVLCVQRHWFLQPVARLAHRMESGDGRAVGRSRT